MLEKNLQNSHEKIEKTNSNKSSSIRIKINDKVREYGPDAIYASAMIAIGQTAAHFQNVMHPELINIIRKNGITFSELISTRGYAATALAIDNPIASSVVFGLMGIIYARTRKNKK